MYLNNTFNKKYVKKETVSHNLSRLYRMQSLYLLILSYLVFFALFLISSFNCLTNSSKDIVTDS